MPADLIALFAQQNPQLFSERTSLEAATSSGRDWADLGVSDVPEGVPTANGNGNNGNGNDEEYETQFTPVYGNGRATGGRGQGQGDGNGDGADSRQSQQREAVGAAR